MAFDKSKYDIEYTKSHIKCKRIPFNDMIDDDKELFAWLGEQVNVTQYVKGLIRADMEAKKRAIRCQMGCQIETATAGTVEE